MNITVIGRGRVGGGLARLWEKAGHEVRALGRDGGDASDADVVVVAVPGNSIAEALQRVTGLKGQVTIDTTNLYTERDSAFPSLSHQIKSVIGGPTAKSFSTVFASAYEQIGAQRVTPSSLYAAEPDAKGITARLIGDAGFDPVYVGDLDPGARLLEDSSALTRALAGQMGPFFYRYARPGEL
ncbi:dinucleotide-binding protein [Streptomyces sp. NBC_00878]|uniref:dinucleotide-binding protein n=1 Tax=Streptomyces sp. NBC_00878 TaxID=2975854 RepID=UPI00225A7F4F|nr:dinucleotide-binding protein [Streptomyces sp. NBC_00878]MCX4903731.1 dinucleotide-binding protein [Streptomyces sp. NBC_00878]